MIKQFLIWFDQLDALYIPKLVQRVLQRSQRTDQVPMALGGLQFILPPKDSIPTPLITIPHPSSNIQDGILAGKAETWWAVCEDWYENVKIVSMLSLSFWHISKDRMESLGRQMFVPLYLLFDFVPVVNKCLECLYAAVETQLVRIQTQPMGFIPYSIQKQFEFGVNLSKVRWTKSPNWKIQVDETNLSQEGISVVDKGISKFGGFGIECRPTLMIRGPGVQCFILKL